MRIPTDQIDENALPRDRTQLDAAALTELQHAVAANGLRNPIEVFATQDGYGLISGYRRLHAIRALHDLTGDAKYAQIDTTLRTPQDQQAALAQMIEENEIRADLSPWERALIAVRSTDQGLFPTLDAALQTLYPQAARQKRAKLRGVAEVIDATLDLLAEPETLSEARLLRIANVLRLGWTEILRTALEEASADTASAQWQIIRPILEEAETLQSEDRPTRPDRPRRLSRKIPRLTIRRERTRNGFCLHFTGPRATDVSCEEVLRHIEWMYEEKSRP